MPITPIEVVQTILKDSTNPDVLNALVAPDATYVWLNYENADLKKIMPWTASHKGPQAIIDTLSNVSKFWQIEESEVGDVFGSGQNVAVFGRFTYRSTFLGKAVTSPFSIFVKVNDGNVTYMQCMEDTFATSASFRSGGPWTLQSDFTGKNPNVQVYY